MIKLSHLSITARLTLYFSVTMAIVLYSVSGVLYSTMRQQLNHKDELELQSSIQFQQEIATAIGERQDNGEAWQTELLESVVRQERLSLRIFSPEGKVYAQSNNMVIPEQDFPLPAPGFSYREWHYRAGDVRQKYLITSTLFTLKNHQKWLVQAALNVSGNNEIINTYYKRMQIIAALAILLFAAFGWWLARRGLAPLRTITTEIEKIHANDLHTRILDRRWPPELHALAASFDRMMMRLEASFHQLNRFSSDIAHELRGPINNLISAASVIQTKDRSAEEYQETLAAIIEEGERLSRMISSMLFLARADNSRELLNEEWLSSAHEFEKLIGFYDILAEDKNITLVSRGDLLFYADPQLIQRALSNLLSNALRHTPENGHITLSAEIVADRVVLSVSDDGEGINPEHLPLIFDRFFRGEASRSATENTGLGLAIVKTIAELHGGKISVVSERGRGSTFTLTLLLRETV
ncbi:heavy metal sensor histidine kinase [Enterobacteriaceae bacterium RIT693]|jgi:two-component system heavy metal sensor histidine kinase CusS|nr:heavy metal sensor histidine kinase [Enterobacteriaceae bacterium RIT693]